MAVSSRGRRLLYVARAYAPGSAEKYRLYEHCSLEALEVAAGHGHLEVVQWLYSKPADACWTKAEPMDLAVANGHLAVVQWLHTNTSVGRCCIASVNTAAANGHLELLVFKGCHE